MVYKLEMEFFVFVFTVDERDCVRLICFSLQKMMRLPWYKNVQADILSDEVVLDRCLALLARLCKQPEARTQLLQPVRAPPKILLTMCF